VRRVGFGTRALAAQLNVWSVGPTSVLAAARFHRPPSPDARFRLNCTDVRRTAFGDDIGSLSSISLVRSADELYSNW